MLNYYNVFHKERLVQKIVSTDEQSAIKTVWMRSGNSASRYSCNNLSDYKAEKAL